MFFRVLLMMGILLGLWIGAGAPLVGLGLQPMQPNPNLPSFSDLVRDMEENPEKYEQMQPDDEAMEEMEERVCAISPKHCRDDSQSAPSQEAPELD